MLLGTDVAAADSLGCNAPHSAGGRRDELNAGVGRFFRHAGRYLELTSVGSPGSTPGAGRRYRALARRGSYT